MSLPVGVGDSMTRLDDRLAEAERDVDGLIDLLVHDGTAAEEDLVFLRRKKALIGHLRNDLAEFPRRLEAG